MSRFQFWQGWRKKSSPKEVRARLSAVQAYLGLHYHDVSAGDAMDIAEGCVVDTEPAFLQPSPPAAPCPQGYRSVQVDAAPPTFAQPPTPSPASHGTPLHKNISRSARRRSKPAKKSLCGTPAVGASAADFAAADVSHSTVAVATPPPRTLDALMNNLSETFSQQLLRLITERGCSDAAIYKKARVDRRHFSKIRSDKDYLPTKRTVFLFALALELSLDETIDLLASAGYAFSSGAKFDVILCYFIEVQCYNLYEINEVLYHYQQPLLGE